MCALSFSGFRRLGAIAVPLIALLTGCQSLLVENKTVAMSKSLSDLQYGQVMDNLALMANNPSGLPHYALANSSHGTVQLAGSGNAGLSWDRITAAGKLFDRVLLDKETSGFSGSRLDNDEWDTTPDIDPVQEILMQGLYRKALGCEIPPYQEATLEAFFFAKPPSSGTLNSSFNDALNTAFGEKPKPGTPLDQAKTQMTNAMANYYRPEYSIALHDVYSRIAPGFIGVGHKKDVPADACYVGKCCDTFVWVKRTNMADLTNLTVAVLDVANTDLSAESGRTARGQGLLKLKPTYGVNAFVLPSQDRRGSGPNDK